MRNIKYLFIILAFVACKNKTEKQASSTDSMPKSSLTIENIQQQINNSKTVFPKSVKNLAEIKQQMFANIGLGIVAIPINELIVNKYIGSLSVTDRDSLYVAFLRQTTAVITNFNDSCRITHQSIIDKLESGKDDDSTKLFIKCLSLCKLNNILGEEGFYVTEPDDYYYKIFGKHCSPSMVTYLERMSKDNAAGFQYDAGMVIEYDELYERIAFWENFTKTYPEFFMNDAIKETNKMYLSTLLSGMDNSPVFNYSTDIADSNIVAIYKSVADKNPDLPSSQIIKEWYELLEINNFKKPENIYEFLTKQGLTN